MLPEILLGNLQIRSDLLFLAAALLVGCLLAFGGMAGRMGSTKSLLRIAAALAGAAIGGKLFYLALHGAIGDWVHGYVLDGALVGCLAALYRQGAAQDATAPAVAASIGLGRLGCLLSGCCYGQSVGRISVPALRALFYHQGLYRVPVPLLSAVLCCALAILLLAYQKRCRREGAVFGLLLLCYSIGRFWLLFLRGDERILFCGLTTGQWFCVALFPFAVAKWLYGTFDRKRQNKNKTDSIDVREDMDNLSEEE